MGEQMGVGVLKPVNPGQGIFPELVKDVGTTHDPCLRIGSRQIIRERGGKVFQFGFVLFKYIVREKNPQQTVAWRLKSF